MGIQIKLLLLSRVDVKGNDFPVAFRIDVT